MRSHANAGDKHGEQGCPQTEQVEIDMELHLGGSEDANACR